MRPSPDFLAVLAAVAFAFVLSHVLAFTYVKSHRALSFSVSFVRIQILVSMTTTVMIMAIGDNIAYGLGVLGGLALIQFRSSLRDPRDMIFVFAAVIVGLCAGTGAYMVGSVGTVSFCLAAVYLNWVPFGTASSYDGILRYTANVGTPVETAQKLLASYCASSVLSMMQHVAQGEASEQVYQIRLRRNAKRESLVRDLGRLPGVSNISLMLEDTRLEP